MLEICVFTSFAVLPKDKQTDIENTAYRFGAIRFASLVTRRGELGRAPVGEVMLSHARTAPKGHTTPGPEGWVGCKISSFGKVFARKSFLSATVRQCPGQRWRLSEDAIC